MSGFLLLDEDIGGRRIPSAVATAPGILSESITLVLAAPSARPTGVCRPPDGRPIGLLPMPNHKTSRARAIKLSALKADPENCRLHTTRNLAMITASLNDVGPARSIVIDERGVVLAGEGVRRAAITAGIHTVEVVEASGDAICQRTRSAPLPSMTIGPRTCPSGTATASDLSLRPAKTSRAFSMTTSSACSCVLTMPLMLSRSRRTWPRACGS